MSVVSVYQSEPFEQMEQIAKLTMQGKSAYAIARQLKMPTTEVQNYQKMWYDHLANDKLAQDVARDLLNQMVEHYNVLISELHTLLEDLKDMSLTHQVAAQINTTAKNIADLDARRVDLMQKAGMLEGAEIGAELADMERKHEILINILNTNLCDMCKPKVKRRLREVTGKVENLDEDSTIPGEVVDDE